MPESPLPGGAATALALPACTAAPKTARLSNKAVGMEIAHTEVGAASSPPAAPTSVSPL